MSVYHNILSCIMGDSGIDGEQEYSFRRTIAYALCSVTTGLLIFSMLLNAYEGRASLLLPLSAVLCVSVACLLWIHYKGTHSNRILFGLNSTLVLLGMFLILKQRAPDGSSLFWFVIFPAMLLICLGLRLGTLLFLVLYVFLGVMFFTPLDAYLAQPPPWPVRIRFMVSLFGAYFFSLWAEYLRHKTYRMLVEAMDILERDALTDHLTGLANRRDFYHALPRIMAGCRRKGEPYTLAILDIDHFKCVNDGYGHQTGDKVLRHVAATIAEQVRDEDYLFRWGGEEFAVLMPGCQAEQALCICERIRSHLERTPYTESGVAIFLTISIGLYCGSEVHNQDLPVMEADRNLYAAKASGRNRVVLACTGGSPENGEAPA